MIALADDTVAVLRDYIDQSRENKTDEYDRKPLLTTRQGRISEQWVRKTTYRVTHPCIYGPCPHDRDPDDCDFRQHGYESRCPSARSPHEVRTGSISWMRERGIPIEVVSERVDSTPETIREHYEFSDPRERLEQRRDHINDL
jgi:hypothetical protein